MNSFHQKGSTISDRVMKKLSTSKKIVKPRVMSPLDNEDWAVGIDAGIGIGRVEGYKKGFDEGHSAGWDLGFSEGFADGRTYEDGFKDGEAAAKAA